MANLQLPEYLQGVNAPDFTDRVAANLGSSAPPYLSIQDNKFAVVDIAGNRQAVGELDAQRNLCVDVIIVDVLEHKSKVYFHDYDPNNLQPPICWSDNGVGPSKLVGQPQARTCAECQWAAWGSAKSKITGEDIPACADIQKLAIIIPQFSMDMLLLLRVPPNSLKNFKAYSEQFRGKGFTFAHVITRVSFEAGIQGTLQFKPINFIAQDHVGAVKKAIEGKAADILIGRNDAPKGLPAPAPVQQLAAPAAPIQQTAQAPVQQQLPMQEPAPQPAQQAAPAAQPTRKRRGRPPANQAPQQATQPAQAPFPHSSAPSAAPQQTMTAVPSAGPAPAANGGAPFGIQDAPAPDQGMMDTIKGMFG